MSLQTIPFRDRGTLQPNNIYAFKYFTYLVIIDLITQTEVPENSKYSD